MKRLLNICWILLLAAPLWAQWGGTRQPSQTQSLADWFGKFLLDPGQQLDIPYALSDSLIVTGPNPVFTVGATPSIGQGRVYVASGNVGIGTRAPIDKLQVNGDVVITGGDGIASGTNGLGIWFATGSNTSHIRSIQNGTAWRDLQIDGNAITIDPQAGGVNFKVGTGNELTVNTGGNFVGINTGSPGQTLDINGSARIATDNTLEFGDSGTRIVGSSATDFLRFDTNASEAMRIISSGNVGIGTSSPGGLLEVDLGTNVDVIFEEAGGAARLKVNNDANSDFGALRIDAAPVSFNGGNVGIGTASPTNAGGWQKFIDITSTAPAYWLQDSNTAGEGGMAMSFATLFLDVYGSASASQNNIVFRTEESNSQSSPTERMRVGYDGLIGIGTSAPAEELHVHRAASQPTSFRLTNDATGATATDGLALTVNGVGLASIAQAENNDLTFETNAIEQMRIKNSGYIGINSQARLFFDGVAATGSEWIDENGAGALRLVTNGSARVTVENGGNVNLNSNKIVSLADPTAAQDAATKAYVDAEVAAAGSSGDGRWTQLAIANSTQAGTQAFTTLADLDSYDYDDYVALVFYRTGADFTAAEGDYGWAMTDTASTGEVIPRGNTFNNLSLSAQPGALFIANSGGTYSTAVATFQQGECYVRYLADGVVQWQDNSGTDDCAAVLLGGK